MIHNRKTRPALEEKNRYSDEEGAECKGGGGRISTFIGDGSEELATSMEPRALIVSYTVKP